MISRVTPSLLLALVVFATGACAPNPPPVDVEAWTDSVRMWQSERQDRLREPDSWLTLVGLYWLREGANSFGSAADNDIVFPPDTPPRLGVIRYGEEGVHLEAVPGTGMTLDGRTVHGGSLRTDHDDSTSVMAWGSLNWYLIERGEQVGLRLKDTLASARVNFDGLEYYPIDLSWRIDATFESYDPPRTIAVPTILGTVSNSQSPGEVVFKRNGVEHRLQAVGDPEDDEYFLIFADETNGSSTYGGGRFLYSPAPDERGNIVVDFNRAYSPPCVFSPYATCPLPPAANTLALAIEAGEKMYHVSGLH